MRGIWRRHMLTARVTKRGEIDAAEEMLARAEQHWRDPKMHLVDQAGLQIFPDGSNAAAQTDILAAGRFEGALERRLDAIGDEMKGGAARHGNRQPRMMREHENGNVIGRIVAPPPFPSVVGPGSTDGPEHIATQDPGAEIGETARRKIVVGAGRSAILAQHGLKRPGRDKPLVQRLAAHPQRVLETLLRAGTVAVERYR